MDKNQSTETKKIWFKAKNYGWGWYPVTWQGWSVIIIVLYLVYNEALRFDKNTSSAGDTLVELFVPVTGIITLLLIICYVTGEKPEWRWGKKDE